MDLVIGDQVEFQLWRGAHVKKTFNAVVIGLTDQRVRIKYIDDSIDPKTKQRRNLHKISNVSPENLLLKRRNGAS